MSAIHTREYKILELTVVILRFEIRVSVLEPDVSDLKIADTDVLAVGVCADLSLCDGFESIRLLNSHARTSKPGHEIRTMSELTEQSLIRLGLS